MRTGLCVAAMLVASCGDPSKPWRQAVFFKVESRAPGLDALVGGKAVEVELPDQHGVWRVIPVKGRPCVVLFADADFVDLLIRWKDAVQARYGGLPIRWVARIGGEGAAMKAAARLPAGVRLHCDVEGKFESGWKVDLRGVYVFFVDGEGVVRAAVRGAWTFEKMEGLFAAIDDRAR